MRTWMGSKPRRSHRPKPRPAGPDQARAAQLRAANINPRTGLATDYLNHFNEAVMLLEMIPDMPECAEDFLGWHPLTYREHFMASNFRAAASNSAKRCTRRCIAKSTRKPLCKSRLSALPDGARSCPEPRGVGTILFSRSRRAGSRANRS